MLKGDERARIGPRQRPTTIGRQDLAGSTIRHRPIGVIEGDESSARTTGARREDNVAGALGPRGVTGGQVDVTTLAARGHPGRVVTRREVDRSGR